MEIQFVRSERGHASWLLTGQSTMRGQGFSAGASGSPGQTMTDKIRGAVPRIVTACLATAILLVAVLITCLATWPSLAAEPLPRSILILEQSDVRGPFYTAIYSGLQSELN